MVSPGIQREIALSDSGGAAQLPSGSIFRSTVYCNLYLRRVRTWLSDWGNFIFDSWNIVAPCGNRPNSEHGIRKYCFEMCHLGASVFVQRNPEFEFVCRVK